MTTASFYVEQAKLLLLWAGTATDPIIKEQLRLRAQEYLLMADALDAGASQGSSPPGAVVQQQQQIQPEKKKE
jgi:hypothetical protein